MVTKTVKLNPRKRSVKDITRGGKLNPAAIIGTRLAEVMVTNLEQMVRETKREIADLYETFAEDWAMDASMASQARIIMNKLQAKFTATFARIAQPAATRWMDQVNANSASTLKTSLKEIAGEMTLKTDVLNNELKDVFTASVTASVELIKRVPAKYFEQINGAVMRSIQLGGADNNLQASLEKLATEQGITVRNWAKNVAMDQTRKAYVGMTMGRMDALGLDSYEWVHSGGSNHPREYHQKVLNGKIFKISDPPIIDEKTEERGIPGQLPYCRCTMRPIFKFTDNDDDE